MKTSYLLMGAAAAAVVMTGAPDRAAAEAAYATQAVNMRAGPGTDFPVVTALAANHDVEIYGCLEGRTWCDVGTSAGRGWVAGEHLAYSSDGVIVGQASVEIPVTTYEPRAYWDTYYADRDFYAQRDQYIDRDYGTTTTTTTTTVNTGQAGGALSGAATGAAVGAITGGPVGAAVGGVVGGVAGAAIDPPEAVRTYVVQNRVEPVSIEQQVQVGAAVPESVVLHQVPEYQYEYTYVNGQPVLVDPGTRQIVYIVQ